MVYSDQGLMRTLKVLSTSAPTIFNLTNKKGLNMIPLRQALLQLGLVKTGSRVFGKTGNLDNTDHDFFGAYTDGLNDALLKLGLERTERGGIWHPTVRYQLADCDVFLFKRVTEYRKYDAAHAVAEELQLRAAVPLKEDFLKVFESLLNGARLREESRTVAAPYN